MCLCCCRRTATPHTAGAKRSRYGAGRRGSASDRDLGRPEFGIMCLGKLVRQIGLFGVGGKQGIKHATEWEVCFDDGGISAMQTRMGNENHLRPFHLGSRSGGRDACELAEGGRVFIAEIPPTPAGAQRLPTRRHGRVYRPLLLATGGLVVWSRWQHAFWNTPDSSSILGRLLSLIFRRTLSPHNLPQLPAD